MSGCPAARRRLVPPGRLWRLIGGSRGGFALCVPLILAAAPSRETLLASSAALMFSTPEHCRLSDLAFGLAIRNAQFRISEQRNSTPPELRDAFTAPIATIDSAANLLAGTYRALRIGEDLAADCDPRKTKPDSLRRSYGALVGMVDAALSPLAFRAGATTDELDLLASNPQSATTNQWPKDWSSVHAVARQNGAWVRAMRSNSEHFGGAAAEAVQLWHRAALREASDGRLWAALYYEAFASHYLQDLFAPGHIRAPRTAIGDMEAASIHDFFNRAGVEFVIDWPTLVARLLLDSSRQPTPSGLATGIGKADASLQTFLESEGLSRSGRTSGSAINSRDTVRFYGDGDLHRSHIQELFITLVTANSIVEVLNAFTNRTMPPDPILVFSQWSGYRLVEPKLIQGDRGGTRREWEYPVLTTAFGAYRPMLATGPVPQDDVIDLVVALRAPLGSALSRSAANVRLGVTTPSVNPLRYVGKRIEKPGSVVRAFIDLDFPSERSRGLGLGVDYSAPFIAGIHDLSWGWRAGCRIYGTAIATPLVPCHASLRMTAAYSVVALSAAAGFDLAESINPAANLRHQFGLELGLHASGPANRINVGRATDTLETQGAMWLAVRTIKSPVNDLGSVRYSIGAILRGRDRPLGRRIEIGWTPSQERVLTKRGPFHNRLPFIDVAPGVEIAPLAFWGNTTPLWTWFAPAVGVHCIAASPCVRKSSAVTVGYEIGAGFAKGPLKLEAGLGNRGSTLSPFLSLALLGR